MERKKIVHRLDTPYSTVEWPQISQENQDVILELLCRLLAPLGSYRKLNTKPSKGKRKRARKEPSTDGSTTTTAESSAPPPPAPELAAYIDVGLANISRNLQGMTAQEGKTTSTAKPEDDNDTSAQHEQQPATTKKKDSKPPCSIVFVARSGQSSAFNCHFPQMVAAAASKRSDPSETEAIRLVGFSKSCEERLAAALGIPRVSSIALREGAPQAKGLVDFVRENVRPVEVAWIQEARSGEYLKTNIEAVSTLVGSKRSKNS
ncbi:hypothetical protein B0T17DRAFT_529343 [Bombardia bombarda]|uniref:Uncharacterized protein n=1 Tax=Bombardia bombarda TaxID=252184 RepID=A0AA40CA64_9PEZI|nr:hypothetical protein B0T17DRAFT_529343 [Bombardia bombarda]